MEEPEGKGSKQSGCLHTVHSYTHFHLNFFRTHLLLFIIVPTVFSIIFYLINHANSGNEPFVSYMDSLFLCISAVTVSGLYSVNLSNLHPARQAILALLTACGSYSFVSTAMVLIRRHYFSKAMKTKFDQVLREKEASGAWKSEDAQSPTTPAREGSTARAAGDAPNLAQASESSVGKTEEIEVEHGDQRTMRRRRSSAVDWPNHPRLSFSNEKNSGEAATTIESGGQMRRRHASKRTEDERAPSIVSTVPPHSTDPTTPAQRNTRRMLDRGYGGFSWPTTYVWNVVQRIKSRRSEQRHLTRTQTLQSIHHTKAGEVLDSNIKVVPYLTFDAVVGKNSRFLDLTREQKEELGGIELRALNLLSIIVPAYWLIIQMVGFIIMAPYMARAEFKDALTGEAQAGPVNSTWFSLFQVISAYGNNGMSLIDASLVPLQTAYVTLWVLMIEILAGNTAFPIFLRFFIWVGRKCVRQGSAHFATLSYILDHPRRCYLYLFPSVQTWYLTALLASLTVLDWVLFLVLDIGNEAIESIPTGIRIQAGLVQAVSVRCGGFQIVGLSGLAPAVQFLYMVMMYVGALPIALGVRSTNVYEDRAIAVFESKPDEEEELGCTSGLRKGKLWGDYITWHFKRQLSFDLWWLALAIFLICIAERREIMDEAIPYITVWSIIFEVVSAYGTVGLSLGVTGQNYSLSGALKTVSKIVLSAVMLRGRHRSLPASIDRSILLPHELAQQSHREQDFREREQEVERAIAEVHGRRTETADEAGMSQGIA